jgi:hypothetical protein
MNVEIFYYYYNYYYHHHPLFSPEAILTRRSKVAVSFPQEMGRVDQMAV